MSEINQRLEEVLALAATEPAHRPEFFSLLLAANVWVPGESLEQDSAQLIQWEKADGSRVIPFFTSLSVMEQAFPSPPSFLVMPTKTLFAITSGETLFLNARLPTGKEFTPQEITSLLAEEGNVLTQRRVVEGGTALLLSDVAEPPAQTLSSLTQLFMKYKQVRRAYIAHIKEKAEDSPHLLIGIDADSDIESIIQAAGEVVTDTLLQDQAVDICQIVENDPGISHFFTAHITPFYERRWGSFLRDFKADTQ